SKTGKGRIDRTGRRAEDRRALRRTVARRVGRRPSTGRSQAAHTPVSWFVAAFVILKPTTNGSADSGRPEDSPGRLRKSRGLTPISQRKPLILRERSCEMGCLTSVFPQPARTHLHEHVGC